MAHRLTPLLAAQIVKAPNTENSLMCQHPDPTQQRLQPTGQSESSKRESLSRSSYWSDGQMPKAAPWVDQVHNQKRHGQHASWPLSLSIQM